jgi:transcription antitermination factor NusG
LNLNLAPLVAQLSEAYSLKRTTKLKKIIMLTRKNWFAIYTMPRWEKKIAETLSRQDITVYCPLNSVLRQWSDRKKIVREPLFSCYVFVKVDEREMIKVKEIEGVVKFVSWSNTPAVIRDVEIEIIKKFLDEHTNVKLEKLDIGVNDLVRIESGLLNKREGSIISIKSNSVTVVLPALGYQMTAEVEKSNVTVLARSQRAGAQRHVSSFH